MSHDTTYTRTTAGPAASESLLSQITAQASAATAASIAAAASAAAAAASESAVASSATNAAASAVTAQTQATAAAASAIAAAASAAAAAAAFAASDPTFAYNLTIPNVLFLGTLNGAGSLQLKPGVNDHCYLELYARTATPATRSGYFGFGGTGTATLSVANQLNGQIDFWTNATRRWFIESTGEWVPVVNNQYDVGTSTAAPRAVYAATGHYVGATKVVGAQGAAVADATDAASAITQLNALLARLRTHGLIAT